jgi:phosphopantetheinyl transferase
VLVVFTNMKEYGLQPSSPPVKDELDISTAEPSSVRQMSFIGTVLQYTPQQEIVVERTLSIDEDLYLKDHLFVYAPDIKPPSACSPVLPMTVSLEAIAEVAACLVPGFGPMGFEDVKAIRWIRLNDNGTLVLRISAQVEDYNQETSAYRIATTITAENETSPSVSAIVLFGRHYLQTVGMAFEELTDVHPYPLKAEEIYRERRLFHGPAFQCISGDIVLGNQGLIGELTVLSKEHFFASTSNPELLTDPSVLDSVGQLLGLWGQNREMRIFPVTIGKLELYCPTPPAGTKLPVRLQITQVDSRIVYADVEVHNGNGCVWMRIKNWGGWIFRWRRRLLDFMRFPARYLITQNMSLPYLPEGSVCQNIYRSDMPDFNPWLGAGYCLNLDEMGRFHKLGNNTVRQWEWLLGRFAAKDSVRLWLAKETGTDMLHPASFVIENDSQGQPVVKAISGFKVLPHISLAHSNGRAIAIAARDATSIDLELIVHRDQDFLESFATPEEQNIINNFPADKHDEWITRLWCAKEAVGKSLEAGLSCNPRSFEAGDIAANGYISIRHCAGDRLFTVYTQQDGDFIIAYVIPWEL